MPHKLILAKHHKSAYQAIRAVACLFEVIHLFIYSLLFFFLFFVILSSFKALIFWLGLMIGLLTVCCPVNRLYPSKAIKNDDRGPLIHWWGLSFALGTIPLGMIPMCGYFPHQMIFILSFFFFKLKILKSYNFYIFEKGKSILFLCDKYIKKWLTCIKSKIFLMHIRL